MLTILSSASPNTASITLPVPELPSVPDVSVLSWLSAPPGPDLLPADDVVLLPADGAVVLPADDVVLPPADGPVVLPAADVVLPPADGAVVLPADDVAALEVVPGPVVPDIPRAYGEV